MFVGQEIEGEELEVVSGISEYARRVREWRVEFGWPIKHTGSCYILEKTEPDGSSAELWQTINSIRRSTASARDKMLALFLALPLAQPISTAQLRYVTDNKDMRRVRTFVRVLKPAVEGLLAQGQQGADVGDKLRVKLTSTDIQRGHIDFARD